MNSDNNCLRSDKQWNSYWYRVQGTHLLMSVHMNSIVYVLHILVFSEFCRCNLHLE